MPRAVVKKLRPTPEFPLDTHPEVSLDFGASSSQRYTSRVLLPGPVDTNSVMQITNLNDRICIRIPKPTTARAAVAPPPAH